MDGRALTLVVATPVVRRLGAEVGQPPELVVRRGEYLRPRRAVLGIGGDSRISERAVLAEDPPGRAAEPLGGYARLARVVVGEHHRAGPIARVDHDVLGRGALAQGIRPGARVRALGTAVLDAMAETGNACSSGCDDGDREDAVLALVLGELMVELGPEVAGACHGPRLSAAVRRGRLEQELELVQPLVEGPFDELVEGRTADRERERAAEQLLAVPAEHAAEIRFHRDAVLDCHVESFIGGASDGVHRGGAKVALLPGMAVA